MTTAHMELLLRLSVTGTEITIAEGDTITLTGECPPDELIAEIKANKAAVLAVLREQGLGGDDDGFPSPLPPRYVVPPACGPRAVCARLGPCPRALGGQPCHAEAGTTPSRSVGDSSDDASQGGT